MHRFGSALTSYKYVKNSRAAIKSLDKQFYRNNSSGFPKLQFDENRVETIENIYRRWLDNPSSVGDGWNSFFRNISRESPSDSRSGSYSFTQERGYASPSSSNANVLKQGMTVCDLIRSYQMYGYHLAHLDPLELKISAERFPFVQSEDIPFKHIGDQLKKKTKEVKDEINGEQVFPLPPDTFIGGNETSLSLNEIIKRLEETYCRSTGIEYGHMVSYDQANWLKRKYEPPGATKLSQDLRRLTLARLIRTTGFESFLERKFTSMRRFSGLGCEMMIPCLKQIIDKSTELGVEIVLLGMPHRARVGVMANVCLKSLEHILTQFQSLDVKEPIEGEVIFNLGLCEDRFESFLEGNFGSMRRFSGLGCEMMIPCLKQIIDKSTERGVEIVLLGIPHRARVGIMANVCLKPLEHILTQFQSLDVKDPVEGDLLFTLGLCEDRFELFLAKKFPSLKRFSGEGGEMAVPCLKQIIDKSTELGVEMVILGMPHRSRIGVVANVCRKPLEHILTQFQSLDVKEPLEGDVKYHLGLCEDRLNKVTNKNIRCVLMANPSHLECVGALVQGRAKAEQFYRNDKLGKKVLPICTHGDTAICGQGVIYEIVQFSDIPSYTTHGTIHIIVNNQVGFTTIPLDGRSSTYPSDVGKIVNAPVIHVNGHDPEAVVHAANVAAEWRATFHKDIFIDILAYRRYGHNETDEAMFTQPIMYTKIHQTRSISETYSEKLIGEGIVNAKEVEETKEKHEKRCEEAFQKSKEHKFFNPEDWIDSPWPEEFKKQKQELRPTGVPEDVLLHIAKVHSSPPPDGFVIHKGYERIFHGRMELIKHKVLDFSLAEACAFGSLLKEGIHVRLSGQDVQRGTFSQRHFVIHHQTVDNSVYIPLSQLYPNQGVFHPINSCLSEYAVLGFEFGYSQTHPNALIVWEAQFGDFQNTAQCMFDCFIANSEHKWAKQSGLVMNLPHGLDGMGADHSSARPERYLLMCVDDPRLVSTANDDGLTQLRECNWIVAHVTTPANLFHLYRRQMYLPFRKPLASFFPKSLLRLPAARSPIEEFKEGTAFKRIIPDPVNPAGVKKVVFCCGKVFYDLAKARQVKKLENDIAIIRIEQVYPFPYDLLAAEIAKYPNAKFCFAQEEHVNSGYNSFVVPRLQNLLPGKYIKLITRCAAAGSATGFAKTHARQLAKLMQDFIDA